MEFLSIFILLVVILFCLMIRYTNDHFDDNTLTHPLDDLMKNNKTMSNDGEIGNCAIPYPPNGFPKTKCFSCESQSMRMYGTPRYGINTKSFDAEESSKQLYGTYKYGEPSSCFDCE
jgi:hypothetical protein